MPACSLSTGASVLNDQALYAVAVFAGIIAFTCSVLTYIVTQLQYQKTQHGEIGVTCSLLYCAFESHYIMNQNHDDRGRKSISMSKLTVLYKFIRMQINA